MNCENCDECVYIGNGEYLCMAEKEIVMEDYGCPTLKYMCCKEKNNEQIQ